MNGAMRAGAWQQVAVMRLRYNEIVDPAACSLACAAVENCEALPGKSWPVFTAWFTVSLEALVARCHSAGNCESVVAGIDG
jgi:hypothetical protein